jgi:uncharacterized protein (TIGR03435 family)
MYRFNRATLLDLIAIGYQVEYFQVSSRTPLDKQEFDLAATVPAGSTKKISLSCFRICWPRDFI